MYPYPGLSRPAIRVVKMTRTCRPAGGKYLPAADRNVRNTLNPTSTNQNPLRRFTCNAADHVCVQRAHQDLFLFLDGGDIFRGEELLAQKPWLRECQFSRRYADLAIAISRADNKICRERTGEREREVQIFLPCLRFRGKKRARGDFGGNRHAQKTKLLPKREN